MSAPRSSGTCTHDECKKRRRSPSESYCAMHTSRLRKHGDLDYIRPRAAQKDYRSIDGRPAHRVVMEETLGRPLSTGEVVHHIDQDRHNNAPENLQVMTKAEHTRHHNRDRGISKLFDEDVLFIRKNHGVLRVIDLAEMLGVSKATISKIQHRTLWTHI